MEQDILLHGATIIAGGAAKIGSILIHGSLCHSVFPDSDGNAVYGFTPDRFDKFRFDELPELFAKYRGGKIYHLEGKCVMAGGIDPHVHFREPGMTHKADFRSESAAALLGGVTSVMDMPNTIPATVSAEALADKMQIAAASMLVNYGFHIGATDDNIDEIERLINDSGNLPITGIKVFMGSSTGGMIVKSEETLERIFRIKSIPVLVHCEDERTIRDNLLSAEKRYGEFIPVSEHSSIRSRTACLRSSVKALDMAIKYGTRLHLCHVSTKEETEAVRVAKALNPNISSETSVNYLWFCEEDYKRLGAKIKCNPSIKTAQDREALTEALRNGIIDCIGSDHAPHLLSEKQADKYSEMPSGIPSVQHTLPVLLTIARKADIPLERIAAVFSEMPAKIFGLKDVGTIREYVPGSDAGGRADLVVFDKDKEFTVGSPAYKCSWSPYEGERLTGEVMMTFIGGRLAVKDGQIICSDSAATALHRFQR